MSSEACHSEKSEDIIPCHPNIDVFVYVICEYYFSLTHKLPFSLKKTVILVILMQLLLLVLSF